MTTHEFTITDLQARCTQSVSLTYNCDAADTLDFEFKPGAYAELGLAANDRIVLTHEGRRVFSGTLLVGATHAVQAGAGESVQIHAESDLGLLERMAYVKAAEDGTALYPTPELNWDDVGEYTARVYREMTNWAGCPVTSSFTAQCSGRVPVPQGNGTTPASSLILDALSWVPDAVLVQRYNAEGGDELRLTKSTAFEGLTLPHSAPLQQIGLTARTDLVPPVCALVGGDTFVYPDGVDTRTPGAFIFPVPVDRDNASSRAGGASNSQKMVVRGVPVPDRRSFERSEREYQYSAIVAPSKTYSFLTRFFPQYKKLLGACEVGEAVISVVSKEELEAEAALEAEQNGDADAQPVPANYQDNLNAWNGAVYVLTEGSFPASYRSTRNLRGLQWSRGTVTLMLRLPFSNKEAVPAELREAVPLLFPGKARHYSEEEGKYVSAWLARLTCECVLVNRRLRIFDAATTKPCSTDAEYDPALDDTPTVSDYRAALLAYYNATRDVPFEGTVAMLHDGTLHPEELTGRRLAILGKRPEWENMNAVVRSVTWDFETRKLSLAVGSRAVLDFDEYLGRRLMAKQNRIDYAERQVVPFDVSDPASKKEKEDNMSVSPSVSATVGAATTGIHRKPFTLYEVTSGEGDSATSTLWLAGGTLYKNGQTFNVPDSDKQFEKGAPGSSGWTWGHKVKLKWETDAAGLPAYTIYQDYK